MATPAVKPSDHWNTPPEYLDRVYRVLGDPVDLDPCSNGGSVVRSRVALDCTGLDAKWYGTVFCNPPWSDSTPWLRSASEASGEVIALVHVATSTKRWCDYVWGKAAAVCFHHKRISFLRDGKPVHGNRYDCASILYTPNAPTVERFCKAFSDVGKVLTWT